MAGLFDDIVSDKPARSASKGMFDDIVNDPAPASPSAWDRVKGAVGSVVGGTLSNVAAGVNEANAGFLDTLDKGAKRVSDLTGLPSSGAFQEGAVSAREGADYWKKKAAENGQDPESFAGQVYRGVGGAPMGVAEFSAGVPFAAVKGAASDGVEGAIKSGAERYAVGKVFHAIGDSTLDLLGKTGAMTGVMTAQAAAEPGATVKSVAQGAVTGALLSMQGGGGKQEVVRQRLIKSGVDPKIAGELSSRVPDKFTPAELSHTDWEQFPGIDNHDLLSNPESLPSQTDAMSRPQAVGGAVRDSENAPAMTPNRMKVGIEGQGVPESSSSVSREGVEVLQPRQTTQLTDNQETVPSATDMSTIQPSPEAARNDEQVPGRTLEGPSLENPQIDAQVAQHNQEVAQKEQQNIEAQAAEQKAVEEATQYIGDQVERTFDTEHGSTAIKWKTNKQGQIEVTTTTPQVNGKSKSVKVMTLPELADYLKGHDKVPQDKFLGVEPEATSGPNEAKAEVVQPSVAKTEPAVPAPQGDVVGGEQGVDKSIPSLTNGNFVSSSNSYVSFDDAFKIPTKKDIEDHFNDNTHELKVVAVPFSKGIVSATRGTTNFKLEFWTKDNRIASDKAASKLFADKIGELRINNQSELEKAIPLAERFGTVVSTVKQRLSGVDEQHPTDQAAHEAATSPHNETPVPTQAQIDAANYKMGHVKIDGLDISVENPQGSKRSGIGFDGKPFETELKSHYGYIKGTVGKDKDHVDVFVKPGTESSPKVFVVDQIDPNTGRLDEHKIILGVNSLKEAHQEYINNYDSKGKKLIGDITETTMPEFKKWLDKGNTKKAFSEGMRLKEKQAANRDKLKEKSNGVPIEPDVAVEKVPGDKGQPEVVGKTEAAFTSEDKVQPDMFKEPVKNNASGESDASLEAQNDLKKLKAKGITISIVDTKSGIERPAISMRAEDNTIGRNEKMIQRNPDGTIEVIKAGADAGEIPEVTKPIKPTEKQYEKGVPTYELNMDEDYSEALPKEKTNEENGQGRPDGAGVPAQPEGRGGGKEGDTTEAQRNADAGHETGDGQDLLNKAGEKSPADPKLLHAGIYVPEAIKAIRNLPGIKETIEGIQLFFNPGSLQSGESKVALGTLKGEMAKTENRLGVFAEKAMDGRTWAEKAKDLWNGTQTISKQVALLGKDASIKALNAIRAGNFDALPESAKKVFAIGQEFDRTFSDAIRSIFPDFPLRENHGMLTVAYKDAVATDAFPYVSASLEGTKGFTKKYSGKSVSEVMAATGKDIAEWNLWKILSGSLTDHTKFLRTAVYMRDGIDSGRLTYIPKGGEVDFKNLKEIPDKVAKVMKPFLKTDESEVPYYAKSFDVKNDAGDIVKQFPTSELAKKHAEDNGHMKLNAKGESVPNVEMKMGAAQFAEAGKWYGPKAEMVELERYLARDKIRQIPLFKAALEIKGLVTSVELYGGFHFSTISKEGIANRVANALTLATAHKWEDAARIFHPKNGYGAMKLWKESLADPKGFADSPQAQGVLKQLGFTPEKWTQYQDLLYKNGFKIEDNSDHQSWLGKTIDEFDKTGVARFSKDAAMIPLDYLFKEFVPSRKTISAMRSLDTFVKVYSDRLASGEMSMDELAKRTAVHHDNVFGQLNYDSLGIDKNFKTVLQTSLRAPGWQLGNIRSVVNAFRYQGKEFSRAMDKMEAPVLTPEMSWMISTLAVHMAEAGLISYTIAATTGNEDLKPKEFTDWLYPKVSMVTKVMPPGYVKDWASIIHGAQTAPVDFLKRFATSKLAGQWSMLEEWSKNRDYYNTQVYNPNDSLAQQAFDSAKHFVPLPIMVKSAGAEKKAGDTNPAEKILSLLGYNKVPGWVDQSAAISKAVSFTGERYPKTKAEKEHSDLIRKLSGQYMNDPKVAAEDIVQAIKDGQLGKRDLLTIKNHITQPPLERMFKMLSSDQAIDVWKVATPEERKMLTVPMAKKLKGLATKSPEERAHALERWNEIKK
jgi:hypothetical protein